MTSGLYEPYSATGEADLRSGRLFSVVPGLFSGSHNLLSESSGWKTHPAGTDPECFRDLTPHLPPPQRIRGEKNGDEKRAKTRRPAYQLRVSSAMKHGEIRIPAFLFYPV